MTPSEMLRAAMKARSNEAPPYTVEAGSNVRPTGLNGRMNPGMDILMQQLQQGADAHGPSDFGLSGLFGGNSAPYIRWLRYMPPYIPNRGSEHVTRFEDGSVGNPYQGYQNYFEYLRRMGSGK